MAIIATGSKTIIDLSDGKSLSVYLGANQPRTQINDVNANTYSPDWTTTAGKLTITPVVRQPDRYRPEQYGVDDHLETQGRLCGRGGTHLR